MEGKIKIEVNGKNWTANIVNNSSGIGFMNLLKVCLEQIDIWNMLNLCVYSLKIQV